MSSVRSLLFPRSIAIVGASPRTVDAVETTVRSAVTAWGVNPNRDEVAGLRCYPSVADLPEIPEAAFLLVNHMRVEAALEDAVAAGVRAFVVPGGRSRGGRGGQADHRAARRTRARARRSAPRPELHGDVCTGRAGGLDRACANDDRAGARRRPLPVGLDRRRLPLARRSNRPPLRRVLRRRGRDRRGRLPRLLRRGRGHPGRGALPRDGSPARRLRRRARPLRRSGQARGLSEGRSLGSRRPCCAHPYGGARGLRAGVLRRPPTVRGDRGRGLPRVARDARDPGPEALALRTPDRGNLRVLGDECALLADHAEAVGLPFEPFPPELARRLQDEFPNYLVPGNPLDAWAVADESVVYPRSLELMAGASIFDVLLAQADLSHFRDETNDEWCEITIRTLARLRDEHGLFAAATTVHSADPPRRFQELARELDVALLRGPRDSMRALAAVVRRPPWRPVVEGGGEDVEAHDLLSAGPMPEHDSALVLERYGVPFAGRRRAATPVAAASAATELGFPVVVKLDGAAHKGRVGGVILDVETAEAAAEAARRLNGPVLVARQAPTGPEALCGMTRDPSYGPILAVGRGGDAVEELNDLVLSAAPVDLELARDLVEEAGLDDPGDVVAATTLVALSRLALAHPEVESVDVNPLATGSDGAVAVDALVVVGD